MTIEVNRRGILGDTDRHERLHADLWAIAQRRRPTGTEIGSVPLLDLRVIDLLPVPILTDAVSGHPCFRGPVIRTSALQVSAPELDWARSLSRFYRLGRSAETGDAA